MEIHIIPLLLLATACTLFGIAYSDAVLFSPAALLGCLVFTLICLIGFWIFACKDCGRRNNHSKEEVPTHYTDSIKNWFNDIWSKFQNWTRNNPSDLNAGGIFVFRRGPRIEFLHLTNAEGAMTHGFSWRNEANPKDVFEAMTNSCIKPEELKLVPNFSIDVEHAETDPQGNTTKKMVTYRLAEVNPDTKVPKNARWLSYNEAMMLAASDPTKEKILTSCKSEIDDIQEMDQTEYDTKSKACELGSAELQKWYKDSDNEDMHWKVTERRKKKINLGLSYMIPAGQFETSGRNQPAKKIENTSDYEQSPSDKSPMNSEQKQQPLKTGMYRSGNKQSSPSQSKSFMSEHNQHPFKTGNRPENDQAMPRPSSSFSSSTNQKQQPILGEDSVYVMPIDNGESPSSTNQKQQPIIGEDSVYGMPIDNGESPSSQTSSFSSKQRQQPIIGENSFYGKPINDEEGTDCTEAIVITALISTASTILFMSAAATLHYFYPEQFDQFWNQIVMAFDGIKQYFNYA